ncbi:lysoplasmalogenase family protein [Pedobacter quisquiliarum]|uniref:lysoplasmalogenase family protein n=1 Tax=Pedobacter quisquiliarum TaxID=1834438 RepID=UPI001664D04C|nr:lysoplasmalogenase family protein [Pedobacter quisquiliarum]
MPPSQSRVHYLFIPVFIIQLLLYFTEQAAFLNILNIAYVAVLAVLLLRYTKLKGRFHKRVFSGLIVSIIGLLYFAFFQERYTTVFSSMLFYLLPQIFFISAFYLDFKSAPELDKRGARIAIALAFVISISYYLVLRKDLGILKIPVMLGLFTTCLMFMMAAFRNLRVNKESFRLVVGAVLCYMVAEGLFAYQNFSQEIPGISLIYAVFFTGALHLLVVGAISRKLIHTN